MTYQMKFHGRAGSRSSLSSVGQMPVISEHGHSPMPSPPLRIPQKQSRKNGGRGSITPPPPYADFSVPVLNGYTMRPPPAVLMDPGLMGDPEKMMANEMRGGSPQGEHQNLAQWHAESRHRRCRFVVIVSTMMIIIVGLAVGLSLGLSRGTITDGRTGTTRGGDSSNLSNFPIGSFIRDTTLQRTSTGCTSDPSTWRCFPYGTNPTANFHWTIRQADDHDGYQISSSFSNSSTFYSFVDVPLTLLDNSLVSERFVFSFQMNKTVVPDRTKPSTSRVAKCTYGNTTFQAILWTRLSHVSPGQGPARHDRRQENAGMTAWPGLVEIKETSDAILGSMECEDDEGERISDVQAGAGTCDCMYRTSIIE